MKRKPEMKGFVVTVPLVVFRTIVVEAEDASTALSGIAEHGADALAITPHRDKLQGFFSGKNKAVTCLIREIGQDEKSTRVIDLGQNYDSPDGEGGLLQ